MLEASRVVDGLEANLTGRTLSRSNFICMDLIPSSEEAMVLQLNLQASVAAITGERRHDDNGRGHHHGKSVLPLHRLKLLQSWKSERQRYRLYPAKLDPLLAKEMILTFFAARMS